MQLQNNNEGFFSNLSPQGQKILIAIASIVIAALVYTAFTLIRGSNPDDKGSFYDKGSGETVTNNDAAPETYGDVADSPVYLGTSKFLEIGLSKYQVDGIKAAYYNYSKTVDPPIKEVSIDVKSIKLASDSQGGDGTVEFKTTLNRKIKYRARVVYSNISIVRLYLLKGNEQVFDSGDIDTIGLGDSD